LFSCNFVFCMPKLFSHRNSESWVIIWALVLRFSEVPWRLVNHIFLNLIFQLWLIAVPTSVSQEIRLNIPNCRRYFVFLRLLWFASFDRTDGTVLSAFSLCFCFILKNSLRSSSQVLDWQQSCSRSRFTLSFIVNHIQDIYHSGCESTKTTYRLAVIFDLTYLWFCSVFSLNWNCATGNIQAAEDRLHLYHIPLGVTQNIQIEGIVFRDNE
jgi:hypothetical protein